MSDLPWDAPAVVRWDAEGSVERIGGVGPDADSRSFPDLRAALAFVMDELRPSPRSNIGVYPERGVPLFGSAEIERAYRAHPGPDGEPGGVA